MKALGHFLAFARLAAVQAVYQPSEYDRLVEF